ncbi:hypothetical protein [uncultured Polaribacter sp.]|uniref:hypothetical protein n=1 Tax=uncultured Polaribacter sp. TaxID=174711 RepID=UPI002635D6C7|nr:hypothetical protein [uncultured Polaribacter sp.]
MIVFNFVLPKINSDLEKIKTEFLIKDVKYKKELELGGKPIIDLNDTSINVEVISNTSKRFFNDSNKNEIEEFEIEKEIIQLEFKEEFNKVLVLKWKRFLSKFESDLKERNIYTKEMLDGYKKMRLKIINDSIDFYKNQSDLTNEFKQAIISFYNDVYNYISNFTIEEIQVTDRLKFKLNKNQVILLFQSMLDKGVISGMSPLDLYRILDRNTMYTNDQGVYVNMVNTRVQANKLQKGHTSSEPAIEKLSKLFDKNFFSSNL